MFPELLVCTSFGFCLSLWFCLDLLTLEFDQRFIIKSRVLRLRPHHFANCDRKLTHSAFF